MLSSPVHFCAIVEGGSAFKRAFVKLIKLNLAILDMSLQDYKNAVFMYNV